MSECVCVSLETSYRGAAGDASRICSILFFGGASERLSIYLYARRVHYIGPTHAGVLAGGGVALRLQLLG